MLPGKPKITSQVNPRHEVDTVEARLKNGSCHYCTNYVQMEQRTLELTTPESLVAMLIKSCYEDHGARIVEDSNIKMGKTTVRTLLIERQGQFVVPYVKLYICLQGKNVIMVEASSKLKSDMTSEETKRVFQSFKLTPK